MTMNRESKSTGARQGREIKASFRAKKDFLASIGKGPDLKPESFLINLLRGADKVE